MTVFILRVCKRITDNVCFGSLCDKEAARERKYEKNRRKSSAAKDAPPNNGFFFIRFFQYRNRRRRVKKEAAKQPSLVSRAVKFAQFDVRKGGGGKGGAKVF